MKLSLYGSIALIKDKCPKCRHEAFLIDDVFQCCGFKKIEGEITGVKRESQCEKLNLSHQFKKIIFNLHKGKCYLCGIDLSQRNYILKGNKKILIRPEYDHFIPKSFAINNSLNNIFLMCNVCNQIKSNLMFETKEDAIKFISEKRIKNGSFDTYTDFEIENYLLNYTQNHKSLILGLFMSVLSLFCACQSRGLNRIQGTEENKPVKAAQFYPIACCRDNKGGILIYPSFLPENQVSLCKEAKEANLNNQLVNGDTYLAMGADCGHGFGYIGDQYYENNP